MLAHLRKQDKKVFLVANKVDGIDADSAVADFYSLGLGDAVHQIAAAHGRGVTQLLTLALTPHIEELGKPKTEENEEFDGDYEVDSGLSDEENIAQAPEETDTIKLSHYW